MSQADASVGLPLLVPQSVAIIMDGNGRWAQARRRRRIHGHRAGAEAVDRIAEHAAKLGVRYLTLYAFSTENWQRPKTEVEMLWRLLIRDLRRRGPKCLRKGIRLASIGRDDRMPPAALEELRRVQEETAHCDRMTLCLALDYGGAWDLSEMARRAYEMGRRGEECNGRLDPERLRELMPSREVPPVDLLIRTGGEKRISNFLPWQLSYAELLFVPRLWPDFTDEDLEDAFREYSTKERRFGRIVEESTA